jgi:hypothetical protein
MLKNKKIFCGFSSRNEQDRKTMEALRSLGYECDLYKLIKTEEENGIFINAKSKLWVVVINTLFPIFLYRLILILHTYDIFFFFSGYSLISFPLRWTQIEYLRYLDLPILAFLKKKIIYTYQGCDIRYFKAINNKICGECSLNTSYCNKKSTNKRNKYRKRVYKYAEIIIVTTPDLLSYIPKSYHSKVSVLLKATPLNMQIWRNRYKKKIKSTTFKILHAPSRKEIKGTSKIVAAVAALNTENSTQIELILVQNKSRSEVFELAMECNLSIDQLHLGWYGVFSIEMLSIGIPIMCYINDDIANSFIEGDEIPIFKTSATNIKNDIRKYVAHIKKKQGAFSRNQIKQYLKKYHSQESLKNKLNLIIKRID